MSTASRPTSRERHPGNDSFNPSEEDLRIATMDSEEDYYSLVDSDSSQEVERTAGLKATPMKERLQHQLSDLNWPTIIWISLLHVGAMAAPFTFSWQGVMAFLVLSWLTAGIGICLGFHRLFTHTSFETSRPMRWLIAWIGGLAGEGTPIFWVAHHRKHHALSDQEGDPHSPLDGSWWSHVLWVMWSRSRAEQDAYNKRWAPDLVKDPVMRFLDRTFIFWHLLLGVGLTGLGYAIGGPYMACSLLVWGMFLRLVYVLHSTWFVNSATHMWGYRNYKTKDNSRNLWWVALLTFGEGWHNNHHALPRVATYGHRWWEIDLTYMTICFLEKIGLVWNVVQLKEKPTDAAAS